MLPVEMQAVHKISAAKPQMQGRHKDNMCKEIYDSIENVEETLSILKLHTN